MLSAKNLRCERDERLLFQDLSFELRPGEVMQVEGANGSGKTTLLRLVTGLSSAYLGDIQWHGEPIRRVRQRFFADMHYLGHLAGVKASLTPRENLRWYQTLELKANEVDIEPALAKVGLYGFEDVPSYRLSAGQQRRVALARLYISTAILWILDEPFTAIDKSGIRELENLFQAHIGNGGCIMLTTHQPLDLDSTIKKVTLGAPL
jgi:heme exporter protein A